MARRTARAKGLKGDDGDDGQSIAGPSGASSIPLNKTPGLTSRDAVFELPETVLPGTDAFFRVAFTCENLTNKSIAKVTRSMTLLVYSGGSSEVTQEDTTQTNTRLFLWTGAVAIANSSVVNGLGRKLVFTCTGPTTATLGDGCRWEATYVRTGSHGVTS